MLKSLYAKNFALLDEVKVEFHQGLNIITGETGAGKSILIGALGAILGERMGKDIIRSGCDKVTIEAEFVLPDTMNLEDFFNTHDIENFEIDLVVRREINSNGRSRCFINDTPVSLSILAGLGDRLVDLHGQHEHQLLLNVPRHIEYLDEFSNLSGELEEYKILYDFFADKYTELEKLKEKQEEITKSRELVSFQLAEIDTVAPQPNEEEELKREELILRNAELLHEKSFRLFNELYDKDGSVSELLKIASADLDDLARIDEKFSSLQADCENARILVDEIALASQNYCGELTFDADRLEQVRDRLGQFSALKKKYGGTIDAVLEIKAELEQKLSLVENVKNELERLNLEVEKCRNDLKNKSLALSDKRKSTAELLCEKIVAELGDLGMSKAKFNITQKYKVASREPFIHLQGEDITLHDRGIDYVEFLISANPGEEPKPLASVASGGEISRVMLALKSLLANADKIPVLIFDEIDIGISGRIAQSVGRRLRKLAGSHQVISITHLPQIASMAHYHYLVEKNGDDVATQTSIRKLSDTERTEQIARLFGGEFVSTLHLQTASELIKEAELLNQDEK